VVRAKAITAGFTEKPARIRWHDDCSLPNRGKAAREPKTVRTDEDVHHACARCRWIFFACAPAQVDTIEVGRGVMMEATKRLRIRGLGSELLALGLLTATCVVSASDATAPVADGAVVQIVDFMRFEPVSLTVPAGTTVTWINNDGSNHIIQMKAGDKSPRLRHGANWSHSFTAPGEYPYICAIHGERMSGTIIVQAP
jgi:plastocyanin